MKRVITSLSLLLLLLCGVYAQNISKYEYWTDDDYASRNMVNASGGDVQLKISTDAQNAGVHFLNFRAANSNGMWGNFYRYLYYIPSQSSLETGDMKLEYWLDDDLSGKNNEEADNNNLSLIVDVSNLLPGIHYFNCTPISTISGRGSSERYLFYVPLPQDKTSVSAIKGYEYWLDDNILARVSEASNGGDVTLITNLSGLGSGVHYFNCRAFNERGEYGNPVRKMFYIPQTDINTNATISRAEYWLDDDYANKVNVADGNTQQTFTIGIDALESGIHYFNYRAADNHGTWGVPIRSMFYIAKGNEKTSSGKVTYEYWIDDDTDNIVTGESAATEIVFNVDVSKLSNGNHTFNFRAKDVLEKWGNVYSEQFTLYTPGDVNGDGVVTVTDVVIMVNMILGGDSTVVINEKAADLNNDGMVTVTDVVLAVNIILGKK